MPFMQLRHLLFYLAMCVAACDEQAANVEVTGKKPMNADESSIKLTPNAAKIALATMFGEPVSEDIMEREVVLGTCIPTPAKYAKHKGQISCAFLLKNAAGSSESQADFYKLNGEWVAQPSSSQDQLPFPDPKLQ
jgi:hypothetical protein